MIAITGAGGFIGSVVLGYLNQQGITDVVLFDDLPGQIRKENRLGGRYSCNRCGHKMHADINAACNIRDRWVSKSSHSLNCEQDAVNHPCGNSVVLDDGSSAEFQGHGLVP